MKKEKKLSEEEEFEKYIQEIEDPNYDGESSWALPENATPLEKTKYELCKKIVVYKHDNNLSTKNIAKKIHLTSAETRDILLYHISYFTLDRLMTCASRIFVPFEVGVVRAEARI